MVSLSPKINVTINSESTVHNCLFCSLAPVKQQYICCAKCLALLLKLGYIYTFPPKTGRKWILIAASWQTEHAMRSLLTKLSVQHKNCLGMFYFIKGKKYTFYLGVCLLRFKKDICCMNRH